MAVTIQIQEKVKKELESLKKESEESVEEVINRLVIKEVEAKKRKNADLIKEGCIEMYEDSLRIAKEWEVLDNEWPEWKE